MQTVGSRGQIYIVLGLIHIGTQCDKAFDVLVDGTGCKITAAGQCHIGMLETAQQCAHEVIAGAHFTNKYGVGVGAGDVCAIQCYNTGFTAVHQSAHIFQNVQQYADIGNIRHVFYAAFSGNQKRGRQDRHRGILGTVNGDGALQRSAAIDHIFRQGWFTPC